jgi:hypothetical protein
MSSSTKSPSGIRTRPFAYENFQGLDSSRDIISLDTGKQQHLSHLVNMSCDWRGHIVRDRPALPVTPSNTGIVTHIAFYGSSKFIWCEKKGDGIHFISDIGHSLPAVHPENSIVCSTVFNRKVILFCERRPTYAYNGAKFSRNQSVFLNNVMLPSFGVAIQRRLAVAGIKGRETEVHLSRVDDEETFTDDEPKDSENVLRAGMIDIKNVIGTADQITGLAGFEKNRLVIFTKDQAVIYRVDPDIDKWVIDETANINIGCLSHNTIVNAGTDIVFCSRSGVHSVKRSEDNGILVFSYSLSDKVDLLYRALVASVPDPKLISAVFDQDMSQYHIFFPQAGGVLCKRLTLSMNPEGGEAQPKFSEGDFLNSRCGSFLGGDLLFGTTGGIFKILEQGTINSKAITPESTFEIPYLWHGSISDYKETYSITIQVAGQGLIEIEGIDIQGKSLGTILVEIDQTPDDNYFGTVPLSRQYERTWQKRYVAAKYRFKIKSSVGLLRVIGFAVNVRT